MHSAKPVGTLIRDNDGLKAVQDRCAALSRLQKIFADTLPPGLDDSCRVAALEGSTLVIAAANGAVATKLKQMLPRLLNHFQTVSNGPSETRGEKNKIKEQQVTAISVLVQPNYRELADEPPAHAGRPGIPLQSMVELVEKLGDSPLRDAVARLRKMR